MKLYKLIEDNFSKKDKRRVEIILNGSRKHALPYISDTLSYLGKFGIRLKIEGIYSDENSQFAESIYTIDKNNNKCFFSLNNLYGNDNSETINFFSSEYNYVVGKQIKEGHYKLYDILSNIKGNIYTTNNSILCVSNSYCYMNYIYFNRKNHNVDYVISVEKDESLDEEEIERFIDENESNKPKSLFDYLHNFQKIKDIMKFSYINISAKTGKETIGEIIIENGNFKRFNTIDKNSDYELSMTMNSDKNIQTKVFRIEKASIEDLDDNLKSIYNSGREFVKTINKKTVNPND